MKYLPVFLLFFPLALVAQKSNIFRMDSMPTKGVLLDKGWKWHAGDNPEWANVDFDDSNWASINPTLKLLDIPQVREAEICWFRIPIEVDSSLVNVPLINVLYGIGAIEVYLNGKLLQHQGIVSKDPSVEKAYQVSVSMVANFVFPKKGKNIITVRYSFTHSNIYFPSYIWTQGTTVSCIIRPLEGFIPMQFNDLDIKIMNEVPWLGLFLALSFTHYAFYFFRRAQKSNLLFSLAMLSNTGYIWIRYLQLSDTPISFDTLITLIRQPLGFSFFLLLVVGVHIYLKKSLEKEFWLILFAFLVLYACQFTRFSWTHSLFLCLFPLVILYYVLVIKKSIEEGCTEVKILYYTGLIALFFNTIFTVIFFNRHNWDMHNNYWLFFVYNQSKNLSFLSLSVGVTLPLARDFALTNYSLDNKSKEVLQLSTEKHRIATDMHDDIGSDLSALNMQVERIRQKVKAGKQPLSELDHLVDSSRDIAKKVREVIWTINARHDTLASIVNYFDTYTDDFFEPTDIVVRTSIPSNLPDILINGESRKVLLMCFKETLNNVLKHAQANNLTIAFTTDNHLLTVSVQDNGVGFDPSVLTASTTNGNGLVNLQERMAGIGGKCVIETSGKGTLVVLLLPI